MLPPTCSHGLRVNIAMRAMLLVAISFSLIGLQSVEGFSSTTSVQTKSTQLSSLCHPPSVSLRQPCNKPHGTSQIRRQFSSLASIHHCGYNPKYGNNLRLLYRRLDSVREMDGARKQKIRNNDQKSDPRSIRSSTTLFLESPEKTSSSGGSSSSISSDKEDIKEEIKEEIKAAKEEKEATEEELKAAVKEVKEAAQGVTQSADKLREKIVEHGPGIFTRVLRLLVSPEMRQDAMRVRKHYVSDWIDGFKNKRQVVPAILFLYFACIAPAVSFGTISTEITNGSIGVTEFLLGSGISGMAYALLCGQPMAFIAPTGLTLAFIAGLFNFCSFKNLPFFPVYSWVGIWTAFFMITLGVRGAGKLIRYCTHFTDEVFNALLSLNFIYEATKSIQRNFLTADPMNLTMPFVSLAMALGTYGATMKTVAFNKSILFNHKIRSVIKDSGPVIIIFSMTLINQLPWIKKFGAPTLAVSNTFELAGGRDFLIPIMSVPLRIRLLCALPAVLLTCLFFMDQNISVRLVNKKENGLEKGPAYNADMVALGLVTGGLSLVGLPWMCGATVQSMNHVRAMTRTKFNKETGEEEINGVTETRLTGFCIHALIAATVGLLPLLRFLPIPVVSGVFLFLGRKLMTGNSFLSRIKEGIAERSRLPDNHPVHFVGRKKMNIFTIVQILCLVGLWKFKEYPSTAIFFPSVIGVLMFIRAFILPRFFTEEEFVALGDPTPS